MIYHHVHKLWLLNLLEEFGNFKEAASQASMTQSALSQNISTLESQMQMSLVIRERGYIKLTDDGKKLLHKVRPILSELEKLNRPLSDSENIKANINLGAYESIAIYLLPRLFQRATVFHPNLKLNVKTSRTDELIKLLGKGEIDMALVVNPLPNKKFNINHVAQDEFGLYISRESSTKKDLSTLELLGLATISPSHDGHPLYYKRFIKRIPVKFKNTITCDSFETIRNLALSGVMVGLLPTKVANRNRGELIKIWPFDDKISQLSRHHISVISRKSVDPKLLKIITDQFENVLNH